MLFIRQPGYFFLRATGLFLHRQNAFSSEAMDHIPAQMMKFADFFVYFL
jgi:hypothetical protein